MLKRKAFLIAMAAAVVMLPLVLYVAWNFDIGALQKPSKVETFLATKGKHWLVARAVSREKLAAEPSTVSLSVVRGRSLFLACCSMCLDELGATQADGSAQGIHANAGATWMRNSGTPGGSRTDLSANGRPTAQGNAQGPPANAGATWMRNNGTPGGGRNGLPGNGNGTTQGNAQSTPANAGATWMRNNGSPGGSRTDLSANGRPTAQGNAQGPPANAGATWKRNSGSPGGSHTDLSVNGSGTCYIACVMCHGQDGLTPTQIGLSLYPPAPSLDEPEVQRYTDPELFWVVKNGIRLTGMPGFGRIYSDQQIWDLVLYMRTLKASPTTAK